MERLLIFTLVIVGLLTGNAFKLRIHTKGVEKVFSSRVCPRLYRSTGTFQGESSNEIDPSHFESMSDEDLVDLKDHLWDVWQLTEAILSRNAAQIDSFVDADAQWNAMEENERQYILDKPSVESKLERIDDILISRGNKEL